MWLEIVASTLVAILLLLVLVFIIIAVCVKNAWYILAIAYVCFVVGCIAFGIHSYLFGS